MGLRARRGNGPPGPKVKRKVLVAGGPRPVGVGERGQGLATTDGLSMRAGVPSGTQGDGPGRWPPKTRQPGGRTRVCQSGWRPAARLTGRAASKYRTCQAQAGGGGTTPGGQTARDRPRPPREMYAESGQRVGGWAPWGRACAPKPGGGTTTLPQGCFVLCARSSYSNLFSTGGVGRRWTIKQPPDALTTYGGCDILEVDGCRRPTIIRGRVSHLSQRYYYIMGVIDCPDRPPHLIR